jgi:hypothetical protein
MSGMGSGMTSVLSMVAGAVIGKVLSTKLSDKVSTKILAGGQIAAGYFLPKVVKSKFMAGIGTGMIINGAVTGLQSFGVISAINGVVGADEISYDYDTMSGTDELQAIAGGYTDQGSFTGTSDLSTIAAMDMEDGMDDDSDY